MSEARVTHDYLAWRRERRGLNEVAKTVCLGVPDGEAFRHAHIEL
jgi:hypothetical protein